MGSQDPYIFNNLNKFVNIMLKIREREIKREERE